MGSLLNLKNVTKQFQGLLAVDHVNLDMKEHTIHSLIGPNGAGKTTTVNLIILMEKILQICPLMR